MSTTTARPLISYTGGIFYHNGTKTRVVLRRGIISVGCSDVTIEAARALVKHYDAHFGAETVVVQE